MGRRREEEGRKEWVCAFAWAVRYEAGKGETTDSTANERPFPMPFPSAGADPEEVMMMRILMRMAPMLAETRQNRSNLSFVSRRRQRLCVFSERTSNV